MTYFLNLRASPVGGGVALDVVIYRDQTVLMDATELVQAIHGRSVLIGTHGFNVNQQHGIDSLTRWSNLLEAPGSPVFIGALWPGDSSWLPLLDYPVEGNEAIQAGRLLAKFVNQQLASAASLSLVSHSLGALMVLETIRNLNARVRNLVLMAGAIDNNCLTGAYSDAARKVDNLSILASKEDWVLEFAFPPGNFAAGIVTSGHPYYREALGREGPSAPCPGNVQSGWQIPDSWDYGHLDYMPSVSIPANPFPVPVDLPAPDAPQPKTSVSEWKSAWSAAFASTRYR